MPPQSTTYITITAIKYIEGRVIPVVIHVVDVIFHLHFNAVTFIIFTTLELLVPVFVSQALQVKYKVLLYQHLKLKLNFIIYVTVISG